MLHKPALVADKAEEKALHSTYRQRALLQTKKQSHLPFLWYGWAKIELHLLSSFLSCSEWLGKSFCSKSCSFALKPFDKYADRKADWWNCVLSGDAWFTNLVTQNFLSIEHVTACTSRLWCSPLKVGGSQASILMLWVILFYHRLWKQSKSLVFPHKHFWEMDIFLLVDFGLFLVSSEENPLS